MNIVHVHLQGFYHPSGGIRDGIDTGGQTRVVHELARAQAQQGHTVTVVTRLINEAVSGSLESMLQRQTYQQGTDAPYFIRRISFGDSLKFIRKEDMYPLASLIADAIFNTLSQELEKVDILISHYADAGLTAEYLKYLLYQQNGRIIPHIHVPHSMGYAKLKSMPAYSADEGTSAYNFNDRIAAESYIYRHADLLAHSSQTQAELGQRYPYCAATTPVLVVCPGYNKSVFYMSPQSKEQRIQQLKASGFTGLGADDFIICMAARFVPEKGFSRLISALPYILKEKPHTKVLIIGGSYTAAERALLTALQTQSRMNNSAHIISWHKGLPQEKLAAVMRNIDVFVAARRHEPFGMASLEALACGAYCIADKTSGIVEMLPDGMITACNTDNPQALARAIINVPALRSENVFEPALANYTWDVICQKFDAAISTINPRQPYPVSTIDYLVNNSHTIQYGP
ncbi:glycosyltransferase [Chitinophaga vietnamensis]|uniref:glycosyltransferase n=1 Tax=Chitinophaga vietnamensis TaxID=2593957 RepID=UPI001177F351|nr:glycosyltransferase [Chitinophaga vietnamensis]